MKRILRRGESPLQTYNLRSVSEGNCVVEIQCGEQPEENRQSAGITNTIRPDDATSLLVNGEVQRCVKRYGHDVEGYCVKTIVVCHRVVGGGMSGSNMC